MAQNIFKGLGIALITPFKTDGTVDYQSLKKLVEFQIDNGADFLCILATTGEAPCLTQDEKNKITELVKEVNHGRVKILKYCGGNNTAAVVEEIKSTDWSGIDGILSICPYYNKPSQAGLIAHYRKFSQSTDLPIFLYNVPGRTSCNLEVATTLKIVNDCSNIIGIKEASGNMCQILQLIAHKPDNFMVLSGDDLLAMPLIAAGADGLVSVMANAFPKEVSELVHSTSDGNLKRAQELNNLLSDLTVACFKEGNPSGIKAIMSADNTIQQILRLPLVPVSDSLQNSILNLVTTLREFTF